MTDVSSLHVPPDDAKLDLVVDLNRHQVCIDTWHCDNCGGKECDHHFVRLEITGMDRAETKAAMGELIRIFKENVPQWEKFSSTTQHTERKDR